MLRLPSIAAVLLALLVAGCGASGESTADLGEAEQEVAQVVEDLEEAAGEDEPRRVCTALLARSLTQRLGNGCTQAVERAFDGSDTPRLNVKSVRISGSTARAEVETGADEDQVEVLSFVREGDDWRIAAFAGGR